MNLNNLWEAIGKIDDKFVVDAIGYKKNEKHNSSRWWIGIAAAILIVVITFSATYTVSAQFREWVISLFQIKEIEVVPDTKNQDKKISESLDGKMDIDDTDKISFYAADTIEDIFDVQYLKSTNYMSTLGSIFYYSGDNGLIEYYAAENSKFIPIESKEINKKVTLLGITGDIDYNCIDYKRKIFLQENERNRFMIDNENDAVFMLVISDNNEVWLTLYKNPQSDQWSYPAKYDLNTDKTTDILKGIRVDGIELEKYPILRNWSEVEAGIFIVSIGQTLEGAEIYLIDTHSKKTISLSDITGIPGISSVKTVSGKIMIMESVSNEKFNYYCYDYSRKSIIKIYDNAAYWSYEEQEDDILRIKFSGGQYDFIEEKGSIYLVDEFTGTRLIVEGITEDLAESFLINSDNDKILIYSFGDKTIEKLGVIDISTGRFYLMKREQKESITEFSISWNDADHIIIEAVNDISGESYIYLYSLIER